MVLPWKGSVGVKAYREFESPRFRNLRLAAGASLPSWVKDGRLSPRIVTAQIVLRQLPCGRTSD